MKKWIKTEPDRPNANALRARLQSGERSWLGILLIGATLVLVILFAVGAIALRLATTSLIQVGQIAPEFRLPSTQGGTLSLSEVRADGRQVIVVFVPSVNCDFCRKQLSAIQTVLPQLRTRSVNVVTVSTDTQGVQRAVAQSLGLEYPLLSEAPTLGEHPVGSAYGVYHLSSQPLSAPVDANAVVIVDAAGVVRAVKVKVGEMISGAEVLALVDQEKGLSGGER